MSYSDMALIGYISVYLTSQLLHLYLVLFIQIRINPSCTLVRQLLDINIRPILTFTISSVLRSALSLHYSYMYVYPASQLIGLLPTRRPNTHTSYILYVYLAIIGGRCIYVYIGIKYYNYLHNSYAC